MEDGLCECVFQKADGESLDDVPTDITYEDEEEDDRDDDELEVNDVRPCLSSVACAHRARAALRGTPLSPLLVEEGTSQTSLPPGCAARSYLESHSCHVQEM